MASPLSADQLLALCETDVLRRLTADEIKSVLGHAPFIDVEGTFNLRDIGKIPGGGSTGGVRPSFVFRSGMLNHLTDRGKATIAGDLGVRRVFDFRSQSEHSKGPDPALAEAVTMVWHESAEETPHVDLAPYAAGDGEAGFAATYIDVLAAYRPTVRLLLEHVRDRPEQPFLFHCTAGRDRTGVLAGLLLTLAGESADTIALDYMLSRVGSEPVRDQLVAFARMGAGVTTVAADNSPAAVAAAAAAAPPGFLNLINLRVRCWNAFLAALEEKHGGYEGYVTKTLGFSDADVATIKTNLTTAPQ